VYIAHGVCGSHFSFKTLQFNNKKIELQRTSILPHLAR